MAVADITGVGFCKNVSVFHTSYSDPAKIDLGSVEVPMIDGSAYVSCADLSLRNELGFQIGTSPLLQKPIISSKVDLVGSWINLISDREWAKNKADFLTAFNNFLAIDYPIEFLKDFNSPEDEFLNELQKSHAVELDYDLFLSRKNIYSLIKHFNAAVAEGTLTLEELRKHARTKFRHLTRLRIRYGRPNLKSILLTAPSSSVWVKGFMLLTGISPPCRVSDYAHIRQRLETQEERDAHNIRPINTARRRPTRRPVYSRRCRLQGGTPIGHLGRSDHVARYPNCRTRAHFKSERLRARKILPTRAKRLVAGF